MIDNIKKVLYYLLYFPKQEKSDSMSTLFEIWNTIQMQFFPCLVQALDSHTDNEL